MAKLLNVDGTVRDVAPENGTDFKLAEVQAFVEGYVEVFDVGYLKRNEAHGCDGVAVCGGGPTVTVADDDIFLCNEEGLLRGFEQNPLASALAGRLIVGPVVLCKDSEFR